MEQENGAVSRRLWAAAAVLAVVVVALGATLVAVRAQDARPRAEVGDVFDHPFQEDPLPHTGDVLLPWAQITVGRASRTRSCRTC